MDSTARPQNPSTGRSVALWCLVGKDRLLTRKSAIQAIDRSAWMLPRLPALSDYARQRKEVDALLGSLGLDSVRRPMVDLGEILSGDAGGQLIRLFALALEEPERPLAPPHALLALAHAHGAHAQGSDDAEGAHVVIDALAWSGAHLYFSRPESSGRPKDYEVFASLPLHVLKGDEYFNLWFPEAERDLNPLGIEIEIDVSDNQNVLRLRGRKALLDSEIFTIRARISDLARHVRGRFWVTEVINGEERVQDFADPAVARQLSPGALTS